MGYIVIVPYPSGEKFTYYFLIKTVLSKALRSKAKQIYGNLIYVHVLLYGVFADL